MTTKIIKAAILAYVGIMFVINFTPELEGSVANATITNTFVSTMLDMSVWVLPVGSLVGLFYGIFRLIRG